MRNLAAANLSQAEAKHAIPLFFVELQFDEGTERVHNGVRNIAWGGNTWEAIGALGSIEPIEESEDLSPFKIQLSLNGLDTGFSFLSQNSEIFDREVKIYLGFLNPVTHALVADPDLIWSGRMDSIRVRRGAQNVITLTCESDMRFFNRTNGTLYTNEQQQKEHPGDTFFEFLPQMQEVRVVWHGAPVGFSSRGNTAREQWNWYYSY